jgi:5-dehydro-2-deoxygluconokinase
MDQTNPGVQPEPPLDVITIGRSSVDLYGQQIGSRLEDIGSFA